MKSQNIIIGCVVIAVIAGGLGTYGGMTYQKSKVTSQFGQRENGQRMMPTQNGKKQTTNVNVPGMSSQRGMINGEVTAKDDKSITVKMTDGSSKIVILSTNTSYRISADSKLDDVVVGKTVAVQGIPNADGSTTADSIELNPILRKVGTK